MREKCGCRLLKIAKNKQGYVVSELPVGTLWDYCPKHRAVDELVRALKLHQEFWDAMPKGQLGRISCDIGILNQAFLTTTKALRQAEGKEEK